MTDRFVTIATYAWMPEAELAKNLLEAEGIAVILGGGFAANALTGAAGEAQLQVREEDAARAVGLLASMAAQARVDDDWERQAERSQCTCSLCGMALPPGERTCPACGTSNPHITADPPDARASPVRRAEETVKTRDQIQTDLLRPVLPGAGEESESRSVAGRTGCAVVVAVLLAWPVWLLFG